MTKAVIAVGPPARGRGSVREESRTEPRRATPRYQKLRPGPPGPDGLSREQVKEHQSRRLYEAMVEVAATCGYPATTIKDVCALARVSRQTFYDLFGADREACFVGAYDYVVGRAAERIELAYRDEDDPERRLRRAFEQFTREVATDLQAARFTLLEPFAAGRVAFARMDRGRETFEALVAASVGNPSRGVTLSSTIAKGIVGGVERVSRVYLLAGKVPELSATAEELTAWVSCYRPWSGPTPAEAPGSVTPLPPGLRSKDERLRVLRAAAAIAARDGYLCLSRARITRLAGVSEETFATFFGGSDAIEKCFLAAFDLLGVEALVGATKASRHASAWPDAVREAITALLNHVAAHPFLGPVAFIEIFSVGRSAIERRSELLQRFTDQLFNGLPEPQRPSELVTEAIAGAIWAVVHDYVVRGSVHLLPAVADDATYLALAPVIGHEAAVALVLDDRPGGRSPRPSSATTAATRPIKGTRSRVAEPERRSDPDVPLVILDLASVETYVLVRGLSDLALERQGAVWCPLVSRPGGLDLDVDAARRHVERMQLPFVRPERHPAARPRAMRLATLAAARGCGAIFTIRATRLAWATGTDLDRLGDRHGPADHESDEELDGYLRLLAGEIGVEVEEARSAMQEGSACDAELSRTARWLTQLGIESAPALRWEGTVHSGLEAVSAALADAEAHPPLA